MRLRNNPEAGNILDSSTYTIQEQATSYFNNDNTQLILEIGMGKGDYIVGMAKKYPHINFVGVEKYATVLAKALEKVENEQLNNIKILNVDAVELPEYFEDYSIDEIHINFSDPWPKSRHAKRRLTFRTFLDLYKKLLKEDGILKQKTDNQGLFESSLMSYSLYPAYLTFVSVDLHNNEIAKDNVMSEYERKFSGMGQPIYSAHVVFKLKGEKNE
ncbi:tRNA (guanosine(46)-N7)-methyltransferase TrmB [Mycoplasma sp. P36-A1]|uniref:tRNA (guanosine(46)-N7)-methyltransferase TrmB n=1 Tax=Mycoplasma sp. P36-A1 TaxID=3252900 RepID=UPI003C2FDBC2